MEDWTEAVWAAVVFNHPEHLPCDGYWVKAGSVVCVCGSVLYSYHTVPTQGGVL